MYNYSSWTDPKITRDYHFTLGDKIKINKIVSWHYPFAEVQFNYENISSTNPYGTNFSFDGFDSDNYDIYYIQYRPR
jgi:hypothetical protein